jgi:Flp pilus assembly pilin Flp
MEGHPRMFKENPISKILQKGSKGQDLAEYAILIGFIALTLLISVTVLGLNISAVFNNLASDFISWFS